MQDNFGESSPYAPPAWLAPLNPDVVPSQKLSLGRFPTPIHRFSIPNTEAFELECYIKRDDLSSFDLSGNKVRKLEFLLAEAKNSEKKYDSVITVGGLQSNHARAAAVAARQIGLDPFLILRKPEPTEEASNADEDIGLTGNLLFNRMVGADIRLISHSRYAVLGSQKVCEQLAEELREQGRNPYIIPLGGSNALGSFGYMQCVNEIIASGMYFDHIVFGCGSGGTAAGLALGVKLAGLNTQVHAVGVCDSPEYFYHHIAETAAELGLTSDQLGPIENLLHLYAGEGQGYARSTEAELAYMIKVAQTTGIILDPVYSGKGLYHFVHQVLPESARKAAFLPGQKVLYIHTGGTVGLYDKEDQVVKLLPPEKVSRMKNYPVVK